MARELLLSLAIVSPTGLEQFSFSEPDRYVAALPMLRKQGRLVLKLRCMAEFLHQSRGNSVHPRFHGIRVCCQRYNIAYCRYVLSQGEHNYPL